MACREVIWILSLVLLVLYHFQFIRLEFPDDRGFTLLVRFLNVHQLVSILADDRINFSAVDRLFDEFLVEVKHDRWVFHNRVWRQHHFSVTVFGQFHYRSRGVAQCAFYQANACRKTNNVLTIFHQYV